MDSDSDTKPSRRPTRGRGRGRGRPPGRPPKKTKTPTKKKSEKTSKKEKEKNIENDIKSWDQTKDTSDEHKTDINFEDNIDAELSSMPFVTPTSKTLLGNEPQNWKYKVNLIGEKVVNPRIHCCEKCLLPILVYGRMIPCKHVFCLNCSHQNDKQCPRCGDKVLRVEKTGLGTVFMCQTESCKRTYLSQRDLQAHIEHRHVRRQTVSALNPSNTANVITTTNPSKDVTTSHARNVSYNSSAFQSPIPVVSSRSNLITVPIQDEVSISPNINASSMLVSPSQSHSNYGVSPQSPYGHPNPHLQWSSIPTANTYGYRPTTSWAPPPVPYSHPYNRPYGYPQ